MIYELNKIMKSLITNLMDSLLFLLIVFFYGLSVLQLPIPELAHMFLLLIVFSFVINMILSSSGKHFPLSR
ncbi:hypothetical protein SAMN05660964_01750 [Thiothrix caldifontis]|uniref:Uncharacterized protein n=1 Tax=Thiothrix caldifontis TaxID=525918 RepID=A0A1H4BQN1_9GAMM|nr:hypothetical protein SAMN05660964_01750 [Thiothrix caldifontis]